jgi:hypothetical protein
VVEQAPPDMDDYIQPSDSAILLSSLTELTVSRFELPGGDPRSVAIGFRFAPNDAFDDAYLEKRFWWRRDPRDPGWAGLVSEPVAVRWKKGRDPTQGMLGLAKKVWDGGAAADRAALKKKIDSVGIGGASFFAWFGYVGRKISAEQSAAAAEKEKERRRLRAEGKEVAETPVPSENEDEEDLEIFDGGDSLALFIADDLWPNAVKYFSKPISQIDPEPRSTILIFRLAQAQEQDEASDDDFESDEDEMDGVEDGSPSEHHAKKRKV